MLWECYQFKLSTAELQQGSSSSLFYLTNELLQNLIMETDAWQGGTHMA